jgi:glutamate-1-semialdehyde aminotransferase
MRGVPPRLVDFTMGWGSVLLGHAHPAVVGPVRRQIGLGSKRGAEIGRTG